MCAWQIHNINFDRQMTSTQFMAFVFVIWTFINARNIWHLQQNSIIACQRMYEKQFALHWLCFSRSSCPEFIEVSPYWLAWITVSLRFYHKTKGLRKTINFPQIRLNRTHINLSNLFSIEWQTNLSRFRKKNRSPKFDNLINLFQFCHWSSIVRNEDFFFRFFLSKKMN